MRLNKYLAHATGMSRREADAAITAGRVQVQGIKAILGAQVPKNAPVTLDGARVGPQRAYMYLLLHKPTGYLCSRRSQGGVPTIYELLPPNYRSLKPVGRLDKDSSGLILLTDDGDFAHRMTHPSFHKVKIYEVELDKPLAPLHQQMISDYGVQLEDGVSRFLVEKLEGRRMRDEGRGSQSANNPPSSFNLQPSTCYKVTMSEGRNRQIRRTFAALGYTVTKLHRTSFGSYTLADLPSGHYSVAESR